MQSPRPVRRGLRSETCRKSSAISRIEVIAAVDKPLQLQLGNPAIGRRRKVLVRVDEAGKEELAAEVDLLRYH